MKRQSITKVINWIKNSKTTTARVGMGIGSLLILSVPLASALTQPSTPTQNEPKTAEATQETSVDATTDETVNKNETDPTTEDQEQPVVDDAVTQEPTQDTEPSDEPDPVVTPPAPTYEDTYPTALKNIAISSKLDQWGLDNRNSTSYTAWKVHETFGNMPKWGYTANGNANNWPVLAKNSNVPTGNQAKKHSVGVVSTSFPGFTAWVEELDGNNVLVSAYNSDGSGTYRLFTLPSSYFDTYIYFGDL